eukprot:209532-Pyramimonas_sp.AAC.1
MLQGIQARRGIMPANCFVSFPPLRPFLLAETARARLSAAVIGVGTHIGASPVTSLQTKDTTFDRHGPTDCLVAS